ncbi:hypothetical protein CE91St36_00900 [Christensenellaceae bacterium]|nr:hypothetical protein CE91St36_00900 [Christensenellaceae bacterium]BDF59940.1 hypothetical protein CE91St37_00900 [Christensenellaceae bacterium]
MRTKKLSLRLIKYELLNTAGNWFILFFGIAFPILMSLLIANVFVGEIPAAAIPAANTGVFITMSMIIPLATLLIGYAANYSQELENEMPLRFRLFGYRERSMLGAKMIANLIFMTIALAIYTIADYLLLDIQPPQLSSALVLVAALYALAVILFILAHAIATLTGKFGPTYAITMTLYFGLMIICGMMGVSVDRLPESLRIIARGLPMTYISSDFAGFWQGGGYDFTPLLLSFLLFGVIACVFLFASIWKNKRRLN